MSLSDYHRMYLRNKLRLAVRSFFEQLNYLEVDTPVAVTCPGTETYLRYFETKWHDYKKSYRHMYLRSSPEIHMKQLLSPELPRIFQIATCFRNHGEYSEWHHPEFTLLEWYTAGFSLDQMMDLTENFLNYTAHFMYPHVVHCGLSPTFCAQEISFSRISVFDAFKRFANIELIDNDLELSRKAIEQGVISVRKDDDFETSYFKILLEKIEPQLEYLGPTILFDYPPSQAALATVKNGAAKRCEVYIGRTELSNGFEELTDPFENSRRFEESKKTRLALGFEAPDLDPYFIDALKHQFPASSGNALGLDRWLAIICNFSSIEPIIPFRKNGFS